MLIQSTYLIFRFLLNCNSQTKSNWQHWDSVFPKQNRDSSQNPMAERARVWINCATDEGTQHRAKIRLERLTSSDSVPCKCSYDNFRQNLSLAVGWLPHKLCQPQIAVCSINTDLGIGKQSGSKSAQAACQAFWTQAGSGMVFGCLHHPPVYTVFCKCLIVQVNNWSTLALCVGATSCTWAILAPTAQTKKAETRPHSSHKLIQPGNITALLMRK